MNIVPSYRIIFTGANLLGAYCFCGLNGQTVESNLVSCDTCCCSVRVGSSAVQLLTR